jgi:hypothetical protein
MEMSIADLSSVVAKSFAAARPGTLTEEAVLDLAHRIETSLRTAVRLERTECADACAARAALWSSTADRDGTPASLRAEARARANEAQYLADAILARGADPAPGRGTSRGP